MPDPITGAIVGGTQIAGGIMQSKANKKASKAQAAASQAALDAEERMYQQSREDLSPYREQGYAAGNAISQGLGLGTYNRDKLAEQLGIKLDENQEDYTPAQNAQIDAEISRLNSSPDYGSLSRSFTINDYQEDPGFQFRTDRGNKAINARQAQLGNFYSGKALKEAIDYNSGVASQEYGSAYDRWTNNQNNKFNKLQAVSSAGQGANTTQAQLNQGYAGAQGNIYGQIGQSQANAAINQGNIYSGALNTIGGAASSYMANPYSLANSEATRYGRTGVNNFVGPLPRY
jgi:hypothetical protein